MWIPDSAKPGSGSGFRKKAMVLIRIQVNPDPKHRLKLYEIK
jgi:hypothetical protein